MSGNHDTAAGGKIFRPGVAFFQHDNPAVLRGEETSFQDVGRGAGRGIDGGAITGIEATDCKRQAVSGIFKTKDQKRRSLLDAGKFVHLVHQVGRQELRLHTIEK